MYQLPSVPYFQWNLYHNKFCKHQLQEIMNLIFDVCSQLEELIRIQSWPRSPLLSA